MKAHLMMARLSPEEFRRMPQQKRLEATASAIMALEAKGVVEFTTRDIINEIDQRFSTGWLANTMKNLIEHKIVELLSPERRRWRRYAVINHVRLAALAGGRTLMASPRPSQVHNHVSTGRRRGRPFAWIVTPFRWLVGWLFRPITLPTFTWRSRYGKLETRVSELEQMHTRLLRELGEIE